MIVAFSGADGCGKTSLIEACIHRYRGFRYYHGKSPAGVTIEARYDLTKDLLEECRKRYVNVFVDRYFVDELIYGARKRGGTKISRENFDGYVSAVDVQVICCAGTPEQQIAHFNELRQIREEKFNDISDVVHDFYKFKDDFVFRSDIGDIKEYNVAEKVPCIVYDYTTDSNYVEFFKQLDEIYLRLASGVIDTETLVCQ